MIVTYQHAIISTSADLDGPGLKPAPADLLLFCYFCFVC